MQIPSHREYDLNGNTTKENGWNFTFDALDRIIEAKNDQIRVQFSYDFEHRRLSKTTHVHNKILKQYFLYDGEKEIGSIDETGMITELRVLGNKSSELGSAIAIELTRGLFVPIHDLYGNVKYLPQSKNTIIPLTYHYSAFEEEFPSGEYNPWRYGSKRRDIETGLIFYGRRYYSPIHGCWLTKDPIEKTGGTNLYAFVKNNPLRFFDHFGLFTTDRASDAHYFDSHNVASSNFSIGVYGNTELGTVNYYCGINNNRESVESAQLELSKTLGGNYAVDAHWIHNHNLLHGLTLVAATKMKGKKLLQLTAPNLYALEEQNLSASYIYDVIDYQSHHIAEIADKIRSLNDPTLKQLHLAFSHGVECLKNALLQLTEEQRETVLVITLGGTTLIENDLAHKVFNIVGSKDYPSRICNLFYDTDKIERTLIPQTETKIGVFGHYVEQPDYQKEIKTIFNDHINNVYKIY